MGGVEETERAIKEEFDMIHMFAVWSILDDTLVFIKLDDNMNRPLR